MIEIITQTFGYLASVLLAIALLVNSDVKFRWINSAGCVAFVVYGILLNSIPVALTNGILVVINMITLYKIYKRKENFQLAECKADDQIVEKFLEHNKEDIASYFPAFSKEQLKGNQSFLVLRDMAIANIFSATVSPNGEAEVKLNYTVPKFRDYKIGPFLFETEKETLMAKGIKKVLYKTVTHKGHIDFLKRTGFTTETVSGEIWAYKVL